MTSKPNHCKTDDSVWFQVNWGFYCSKQFQPFGTGRNHRSNQELDFEAASQSCNNDICINGSLARSMIVYRNMKYKIKHKTHSPFSTATSTDLVHCTHWAGLFHSQKCSIANQLCANLLLLIRSSRQLCVQSTEQFWQILLFFNN